MTLEEPETSEQANPDQSERRFGVVALVGRPNAGKSTLMNRLLAEKVAIVSDKPQTTRQRMVGILTRPKGQIVFYDTPGTHKPLHRLNRKMMQAVEDAMRDADLVCMLHDASSRMGRGDEYLLDMVQGLTAPRIAVLNKIDRIQKSALLPLMQRLGETGAFEEIVPVSALTGMGCDVLETVLWNHLPPGEPRFGEEWITIHSQRFLASERIREKVLEQTREEIPYTTAVVLEHWNEKGPAPAPVEIHASVLVERNSQQGILIGAGGRRIKAIGSAAREELRELLQRPVRLFLVVRVESGWREDRRLLSELERDVVSEQSPE